MHEYNPTLHPDECEFGMSAVEYVGHTIDDKGVHFSVEKRETVLNIPRPILQKQMKSFLGLCNYFSTHVRHYDQKACPLHGHHGGLRGTEGGRSRLPEIVLH